MKRMLLGFGLMAFLLSSAMVAPSSVTAATMMEDLENALMCKCDDNCGKVLINCTCDTSKKTRKILKAKLESGLTVNQIIQGYVDEYGETVLSAPTKSGFNLSAWVTPFVALMAGGFGVRQIIKVWIKRSPDDDASEDSDGSAGEDPSPQAPSKGSSRLQKELDRLET